MKYKVDLEHDQIEALLFCAGYTAGMMWQDDTLSKKLQTDIDNACARLKAAVPEDDRENVRV